MTGTNLSLGFAGWPDLRPPEVRPPHWIATDEPEYFDMVSRSDTCRILCFGRDLLLLETRSMVLASVCETVAVRSLEEIDSVPGKFDVVVLCHTLSASERVGCRALAGRRWPGVRIVSMATNYTPLVPQDEGAIVFLLGGPSALVQAVQAALPAPGFGAQHAVTAA